MAKSNALELSIRIAGKVDNSLTAAIKTAKSQTSGLARSVSTFAKTSAAALVGVTAAVVGTAATCGKQAADVEKAMAQTRTLLTGTADETQARTAELTQDVMNISRVTGRVSTEIAAGSYQVISAFQDTADTASILETATKAAIAGQAETVDTVNALAAVTKAYGDTSARAVTHVSDLSFETIRLGQTTMPELANGIQKASGSAAALHVSQEELYAGFATLTGVIGNTDTVGTALNTLYTKMLKPSKALSKAVESLGYKSAYAMVQQEGLGGTIKFLSTPSMRRATAKTERKPSAFVSLYTSLHKLQRDVCKPNRKITPLLAQTAGIPVRSVPENHVCCRFALAGHQKISTLSWANSGCSPTCSTFVW